MRTESYAHCHARGALLGGFWVVHLGMAAGSELGSFFFYYGLFWTFSTAAVWWTIFRDLELEDHIGDQYRESRREDRGE
jgi:hypothetical protein